MIIGGEDRPIKVGVNQTIIYCELRGVPINQIDKDVQKIAKGESSGAEIRDLLYSALKDGARAAKLDFPYTPEDIGDWMDSISSEDMQGFMGELIGAAPKGKKESKKK